MFLNGRKAVFRFHFFVLAFFLHLKSTSISSGTKMSSGLPTVSFGVVVGGVGSSAIKIGGGLVKPNMGVDCVVDIVVVSVVSVVVPVVVSVVVFVVEEVTGEEVTGEEVTMTAGCVICNSVCFRDAVVVDAVVVVVVVVVIVGVGGVGGGGGVGGVGPFVFSASDI